MSELPITRMVRWWMQRNDQPPQVTACAYCRQNVPAGTGDWDATWKELVCSSESCHAEAAAAHSS